MLLNQNVIEITISIYDDFLYSEWGIKTCMEQLEEDIKTFLWKNICKTNDNMFNKLALLFNSQKCENKLFKCTKTDDDNIKIDFYPKGVSKDILPLSLVLHKA